MKIINKYFKTILILVVLWGASSCSKNDNINNLNDTLFVRHKDADMPA